MDNIEIVNDAPYLPGAASLAEDLDQRMLLVLRDGRHLVGRLRSFDQYMNLILQDTFERVILPGKYCDIPLGLHIVRGDNIVLVGRIDESDDVAVNEEFVKISPEELAVINDLAAENEKVQWDFDS